MSPQKLAELLERGEADLRAKRFDQLRWVCEKILREHPNNAQALKLLGMAKFQQNNLGGGIALLEQAAKRLPGSPEIHYNLGVALAMVGRTDEAIQHYEQAAKFDPTHAPIHNNFGNIL